MNGLSQLPHSGHVWCSEPNTPQIHRLISQRIFKQYTYRSKYLEQYTGRMCSPHKMAHIWNGCRSKWLIKWISWQIQKGRKTGFLHIWFVWLRFIALVTSTSVGLSTIAKNAAAFANWQTTDALSFGITITATSNLFRKLFDALFVARFRYSSFI